MARRNPPAKWVLPDVIDPPDRICFKVEVPNNRYHIAAFRGALFMLSSAIYWQDDPDHLAKEVALVWRDIVDNVMPGCDCPPSPNSGAGGEGDDLLIRQNPDNPCILETSANGTDWCTLADFSKCFNFGTQGGSGSPQPPAGGGTAKYCNSLSASGLLLLPTLVSTGDVITLDASGSGWDGAEFDFGPLWRCPDGEQFIAGACVGFTTTNSGDPVPTSPHMSLIYLIGSTYYEATPSFTVPGGVVNQQVQIQVNDISLTNNQGSYEICATVQNNAATTFTHTWDFTASPSGWIPHVDPSLSAIWSGGVGFKPDPAKNAFSANIDLLSFPSTTFTGFDLQYVDQGTADPSSGAVIKTAIGGTTWASHSPLVANASPQHFIFTGNLTATSLFIEVEDTGSTLLIIQKLTVSGTGSDPF